MLACCLAWPLGLRPGTDTLTLQSYIEITKCKRLYLLLIAQIAFFMLFAYSRYWVLLVFPEAA